MLNHAAALQIDALSNELRATKRAMGEKETAAGEQVQALTAANAALSRELADARVKQVRPPPQQ